MSSKFTHCYSNYVNHILNNSPTKVTYTFSKQQRFSPHNKQKKAPIDYALQMAQAIPNKHSLKENDLIVKFLIQKPPNKLVNNFFQRSYQKQTNPILKLQKERNQKSKSKDKGLRKSNSSLQKHQNKSILKNNKKRSSSKSNKKLKYADQITKNTVDHSMKVSQFDQKIKIKQKIKKKQESPIKKYSFQVHYQDDANQIESQRRIIEQNQRYAKYSPYFREYLVKNGENSSLSKLKKLKRSQSSRSRSKSDNQKVKTPSLVFQELNFKSKNITLAGYYPVGVQISPKGKYPISTYKNVIAHSFGSPQKQRQSQRDQQNIKSSPKKRKNRSKDEDKVIASQKQNRIKKNPQKGNRNAGGNSYYPYPQVNYYHKNLTDKKNERRQQLKSYQTYNPFSEFGRPINEFKY